MKKLLASLVAIMVLAPPFTAFAGPDMLQMRDRERAAAAATARKAEQAKLKACYEAHGHLMEQFQQGK
ncbi:hypothetical protein SVA_3250 [Sulfurifustis variabilis]|uniref:Uncharacterized protein n=1 Tax=Sulfurifustis variabilis TaxID=1675686 RepID=A0A1C7AF08_9GAMM|nr:hypothetical protein SVA_3250 [Sulfurifustis variabilis]